jgi:hypothetical protein
MLHIIESFVDQPAPRKADDVADNATYGKVIGEEDSAAYNAIPANEKPLRR